MKTNKKKARTSSNGAEVNTGLVYAVVKITVVAIVAKLIIAPAIFGCATLLFLLKH